MKDKDQYALPPGTEIEGCRIERVLGRGGFAITYKATQTLIEREVAIKEYLPTGIASREADSHTVRPLSAGAADDFQWGLDRFKDEAKTLVALQHPNIVPVLNYFEANGTAYMVMAYQHGEDLAAILQRHGRLDEGEIRELVGPLLDGLEVVHGAGFLHRDIKPANIFVREDGVPVLIDFGAARQAIGQHSKALTAIVSESFAPFEQYESGGAQSPASDIYSVGAVMYRCVTGQNPADSPARIRAKLDGRPDPMTSAAQAAGRGYSKPFLQAVETALEVLEKDRPQSVAAFRTLLEGPAKATAGKVKRKDRADEPALRRRSEPPADTRKLGPPGANASGRRSWRPVAIGAGLVLVLAAGAAGVLVGMGPDDSATGTELTEATDIRDAAQRQEQAETGAAAEAARQCDRLTGDRFNPDLPRDIEVVDRLQGADVDRAIQACERAARAHPSELRYQHQLAWARLDRQWDEAFPRLLELAEGGYPHAQFVVGNLYAGGNANLEENKEESARWLRSAAEQDHTKALYLFGIYLTEGIGVPQDGRRGFELIRRAAEHGLIDAQLHLANAYSYGNGVPEDRSEAVRWYGRASMQGHIDSMVRLSALYFDDQDFEEHYYWASLALQQSKDQDEPRSSIENLERIQQLAAGHISETARAQIDRRVANWQPRPEN